MQKPIRQEIAEWKQHKVTKYLVECLKQDVEELKEIWAAGQLTTPDQAGTIQLNSRAQGQVAAILQTVDFIESDMGVEDVVQYEH